MIQVRHLCLVGALLVAAGAGAAIGAAVAQDPQDAAAMMPKPGPEHEILKRDDGKWNAAVKYWMAPGQPPMEMAGTETNSWACNGLWMRSDFDATDGSFSGRGLVGWDSSRKKFVNVWVDTSSTYMSLSLGTFDKEKKVMTFHGEQPDPVSGKMNKIRSTLEYVDANTRRYTSYSTPPGGQESKNLEITYTRAK